MIVLVSDLVESLTLWVVMDSIVLMLGRTKINPNHAIHSWYINRITLSHHFGWI